MAKEVLLWLVLVAFLMFGAWEPSGFTFEFSSRRTGIFNTPRVSARWRLQLGNGSELDGEMDEDFTRRAKWFVERPLVQCRCSRVLTLTFGARD